MTGGSAPRRGAAARPKSRKCPVCGEPVQQATFPFCSKRCKAVDLNRWLSGRYVIPGAAEDATQADEAED